MTVVRLNNSNSIGTKRSSTSWCTSLLRRARSPGPSAALLAAFLLFFVATTGNLGVDRGAVSRGDTTPAAAARGEGSVPRRAGNDDASGSSGGLRSSSTSKQDRGAASTATAAAAASIASANNRPSQGEAAEPSIERRSDATGRGTAGTSHRRRRGNRFEALTASDHAKRFGGPSAHLNRTSGVFPPTGGAVGGRRSNATKKTRTFPSPPTQADALSTRRTGRRPPPTATYPAQCALYLAPSTIPNSGLGMYTAIDLPKSHPVSSPDITIPVYDLNWHNDKYYQLSQFHMLYENYFWSAGTLGKEAGAQAEIVGVMSMGFGALANSHLGLKNLDEGKPVYNTAGVHRSVDPGSGAFCPYHNRAVTTTKPVPAGAELFVDYGTNWFITRRAELGYVPLGSDYRQADKFLKTYDKFQSTNLTDVPPGFKRDLWTLIVNFRTKSSALNALPRSSAMVAKATKSGVLSTVQKIKSPQWLEEHGKCLDNIKPGRSTIHQAGRGAFATRPIKKGTLVISAPLIHIPRGREVLRMYEMNETADDGFTYVRNPDRPNGYQLIMNYCYGHPDSTVMLSPYGPSVSFINHDGTNPNAELRWSTPDISNADWLNHTVDWLETQRGANLAFDYVATRDIEKGEEVFIDYGSGWQDAWDAHVKGWVPPAEADEYKLASELNKDPRYGVLRTEREQEDNPYPSHVETHCRYTMPSSSSPKKKVGPSSSSNNSSSSSVVFRKKWKASEPGRYHPCAILSRSGGGDGTTNSSSSPPSSLTYEVRILNQRTRLGKFGKLEKLPGVPKGELHIVSEMARNGIMLVDRMYSADIHLANVFRHEIGVPDGVFPEAWKNLL